MPISRNDVFNPWAFPEHTYVNRKFHNHRTHKLRDPEIEVSDAFKQKGLILQVTGPSKSGKTIALEHVITKERLITVHGSRITSADSLWRSVINQLNIPMHKVTGIKQQAINGRELNVSTKVGLMGMEASGGIKSKHEKLNEENHEITYDDDLFALATRELIRMDSVLFVDDYHTMDSSLKPNIAAQIKSAAENGVKICLAEVPHRSDEPISANPDLTGRVCKIIFDYWTSSDLMEIGRLGFKKLGIILSEASLSILAGEAGGSPQLMQFFCLETAKVLNVEFEFSKLTTFTLTPMEVDTIFINVVEQVEREAIYNILDGGPDERGSPRIRYPVKVLESADNYEITLAAIALNPHSEHFTWDQLSSRIETLCKSSKHPQREQISRTLSQMVALSRKTLPKQPILDWDEDKGLFILDPYFLFYLRWSEKYSPVRDAIRG